MTQRWCNSGTLCACAFGRINDIMHRLLFLVLLYNSTSRSSQKRGKKTSIEERKSIDCTTTVIYCISSVYRVLSYCCLQWLAKEHPTLNQLLPPKRLLCRKEARMAFVNCATTTPGTGPLASVTIPPVYDARQSYAFSVDRKSAPSAG